MAKVKKEIQQYDRIGGMLWLPALWTVTNILIAGYMMKYSPAVGGSLMALAIPNAYLFWSRKKIYRWFFPIQAFIALAVMLVGFGPQGIGNGSAWTLIFMFYLALSKRARGTFTQPLFKRVQPTAMQDPK